MKAHPTFAIWMVYYFISVKKVKEVPFQTTSKILPRLNFALWIQIYTLEISYTTCSQSGSDLLFWSYLLTFALCTLTPWPHQTSACSLLLIFQNQSPLLVKLPGRINARWCLSQHCVPTSIIEWNRLYYNHWLSPEIKVPKGRGSFIFRVWVIPTTVPIHKNKIIIECRKE